MGSDFLSVYGRIDEPLLDWTTRHNDAVVASLPAVDAYPPLTRGMIAFTGADSQSPWDTRCMVLACRFKYGQFEPEEVVDPWVDKLEAFLSRLYFARANICFDFGLVDDGARLTYHRPGETIGSEEALEAPLITWCYEYSHRRAEHGAVFNAVCHRPGFLPKPPDYWKSR